MLAFVAMGLGAAVIWFVGPLLALDGLRPLASVGGRVTITLLLLTLGILWLLDGYVFRGVPSTTNADSAAMYHHNL